MESDALFNRILDSMDSLSVKMDGFRQENDKWHQFHDNRDAAEFSSVRDLVGRGLGELRDRIVRVEPLADHMEIIGELSKEIELRLNKLENQSKVDNHFYKEVNETMRSLSKDLMPRVQKLETYHETAKVTAEALDRQRQRFEKRLQWAVGLIIILVTSEFALRLFFNKPL